MSMVAENPRAIVGANNPPGPIDAAWDTMVACSTWMAEHPVIEKEDDAREAKKLLDRCKGSAEEIEQDRDRQVRPLNEQVAEINDRYKAVHNTDTKKPGTLDKILTELKARLTIFARAEERRRDAALEAAERIRDEKERVARAAEAAQHEAIENARAGELGVDVTQMVVTADSSFKDFQKADRDVARAERDANVRIGGGFSGRAATLRTKETLVLNSYAQAIKAMGPVEKIQEAILSAARDYRKANGKLPDGVSAVITREI